MLTRDEAIHWLLEDFELMESQRRFDDKLDRLLQMFGVKEERSEAFCLTPGPSYATTKAVLNGTPTKPERVFPGTTSLSAPSIISAARATTLPSIETEEAEGDMTQVEEETEDTLHDLCAKVELKQRADSLISVELKAPRPPPTKFISTKTPSIVAQQKLLLETNQRTLITRISPIEEKWVAGLKDKIRLEDVDFNWKILGLHDKEGKDNDTLGEVELLVHWLMDHNQKMKLRSVAGNNLQSLRVANYMQELQTPWDPGGTSNNLHQLEDKSNIKERGLLGTQLGCRWAKLECGFLTGEAGADSAPLGLVGGGSHAEQMGEGCWGRGGRRAEVVSTRLPPSAA
uniref:Uncharacterized protein n=1 Tax=Oryza barthii TaxID=65489 RepID=A0A0D3G4A7_9ORYZ